jgi:hypothetical protein
LSANESKSELCDSTKCEIESIHNECEGYTPHKKTELDYKICEDIYDSNPLIPTCVVSQSVQFSEETVKEVISYHITPLVEIGENIVVQNQFVAPINMKHEDEGGKNSEVQPIVYIQTSKLKSNENNSDLNLQGTLLSNHDKTSAANLIDLTQRFHFDSTHFKVNSCAGILQVDKVYSSSHNSYSISKPCNNINTNKLHYVEFITYAELFAKISLINYLSYTIFDKFVEFDQMLDNVSMITSMRSFKNVYSRKLTFNLIIEHVVDKFFVSSMCITCDNLAEFKLNMSYHNHCVPYFSGHKVNKLFNACDTERKILFPCLYGSLKERDHVKSRTISSPKIYLSTSKSNEFGRYAPKPSKELYKNNYENDKRSMFSSNCEMFNVAMMKLENLNKLCCLQEIVVLPSTKLFAGLQTPTLSM